MISLEEAIYVAEMLHVDFKDFSLEDFKTGLNIELEHGRVNSKTNVTNDDLLLTGKIALAHLNEFPNYYNSEYGLPMFEKFLAQKLKQQNL